MTALLQRLLPDAERLLTQKEAAEMLGISNDRTLANWRSQGKHTDLPYVRIGGAIRYRMGDLQAYKVRHTVGKTS